MIKKNLKIVIINSSAVFGGTERWALLAAEQLKKAGHSVFLGYRYEVMRGRSAKLGIPSVHFPMLNDADLFSISKMVHIFRTRHIDIVIPTKVKEYWLATIAARLAGKKSMIRLGIDRPVKNKWKNRMVYGRWSDGIIVNAKAIKKTLAESGFIPSEKISVIYNGVALPAFTSRKKSTEEVIFVSVGSLIKRKNFDKVIRAFSIVQKEEHSFPAKLWIIGDGPEMSHLRMLSQELEVAETVRFWGHRSDVTKLLQESDVFVLPSENEGFPNAGLEAMAAGLPVVLSRVAGAEEIIKEPENGFLVAPTDYRQLADRMALLLNDAALRIRVGRAARDYVEKHCSLNSMLNNLENIFYRILDEN